MKEIKKIIQMILETPNEEVHPELISEGCEERFPDEEYGELYTDLYVLVRNIDDFFDAKTNPKGLDLMDSFLLEALIFLKKNPDVIRVESGDDYVKATAYTPDAETAGFLFDDAVKLNTMLGIYNDTLSENNMIRIDAGFGLATFSGHSDELDEQAEVSAEKSKECTCEDENCGCGYDIDSMEFAYATDFDNHALDLATMANSDELDPIVINETLYSLMSDSESLKMFLDLNLQKVIFEGEDFSVFHGNIISDDED